MATTESVKEQVLDTIPQRIKELRFGIASGGSLPAKDRG